MCGCIGCAGVEQVYVHVHRYNSVAQELYQKTGFQVKNLNFITLKIDVSQPDTCVIGPDG